MILAPLTLSNFKSELHIRVLLNPLFSMVQTVHVSFILWAIIFDLKDIP